MKQEEITCIGASAYDTHIYVHEAHTHHNTQEHTIDLSLPFGVKLNCESLTHTPGGNAANVAVGLARLGFHTNIITWIGKDNPGRVIEENLKKEKVHIKASAIPTSNQSIILHCNAERTILAHHEPHKYKITNKQAAPHIYLTSMGKGSEHILQEITQQIQKGNIKTCAWNPGNYQITLGKVILPLLKKITILFLNKEEAILLEKATDKININKFIQTNPSTEKLAKKIQNLGPQVVIITNGKRGAWVATSTITAYINSPPAKAIDTTGAGDAFAAAFYATYLRNGTITECLRAGTHNSISVIEQIGAQPGLLNAKELAHKIMTNNIPVRQIP